MAGNPKPKLRSQFTRDDINQMYGGSLRSYLPTVDGKVVCGCFDWRLNPKAPFEVLVGDAPIMVKAAEALSEQTDPIPIFIKQGAGRWEYFGLYVCTEYSADISAARQKAIEAKRNDDVVGVIYMAPFKR